MGATIRQDPTGISVVRISGKLRKEEMDAIQGAGIKKLGRNDNARVLVMVDADFCGWAGKEVWNDMTFLVEHGDRIAKIAIVGDPKWETRMMMFTGAGFRSAQVKYFTANGLAQAYAWLDA